MNNITKILMSTVAISFSQLGATDDTIVLKYSNSQVKHQVYVSDGKVVGGKSLGGFAWQVSGGAYDGRNLHVTFTSPQRDGCKSWFTHVYEVTEAGPRMLVNVDKCGHTKTDINRQYYWDYASHS